MTFGGLIMPQFLLQTRILVISFEAKCCDFDKNLKISSVRGALHHYKRFLSRLRFVWNVFYVNWFTTCVEIFEKLQKI